MLRNSDRNINSGRNKDIHNKDESCMHGGDNTCNANNGDNHIRDGNTLRIAKEMLTMSKINGNADNIDTRNGDASKDDTNNVDANSDDKSSCNANDDEDMKTLNTNNAQNRECKQSLP